MKMTYKQSWTLFTFTSKDWRGLNPGPTMLEASAIIGRCIEVFVKKDASKLAELTELIRKYFPDWDVSQRKYKYNPGKHKGRRGKQGRGNPDEQGQGKLPLESEPGDGEGTPQESPGESPENEEPQGEEPKEENTPQQEEPIPENGYIKPPIYALAKKIIKQGINLLIVGPAGCGKSRMVEEIAKELQEHFSTISFAGGLRYAQVFGSTKLENGNSKFEQGTLLKAMQGNGVILLDEIFGADPDITLGLNSILEPNSRKIETPDGTVKCHERTKFVACSNTIGRVQSRQYTGAQRSDDSLLDRFVTLEMDYNLKVEEKLSKEIAGEIKGQEIYEKIQDLRKSLKLHNVAFDASTRRLISASKLIKGGITAKEAFELAFTNNLSKAEKEKLGV